MHSNLVDPKRKLINDTKLKYKYISPQKEMKEHKNSKLLTLNEEIKVPWLIEK